MSLTKMSNLFSKNVFHLLIDLRFQSRFAFFLEHKKKGSPQCCRCLGGQRPFLSPTCSHASRMKLVLVNFAKDITTFHP